ncbi:V-set and immunoglobulin domain-containing protein 1-like [Oncorhynchus kisutch]|uniref:V-set and immunoglobulin domain-containing protein 1 n=1 Tax=Oncorhynchus kisutch TaxID=8019 RepID=A0A8C7N6N0_ONCKI|nr:V-set and immunoglobulin domain-containing protein 1-like [Oncorhynchus kisutch]
MNISFKMSPTLRMALLFSMIGCGHLITVTVPEKFVNVTNGESALLQCTFVTTVQNTSNIIIQWSFVAKTSNVPQQVYYSQSGEDVISKPYEGRLNAPTYPATSNASITISNMQVSDAGAYTCEVHNFPDVNGKTEATIIVNILERPSVPFCAVHGDVESGHLVTLTCHSERGSPTPTYTWIRVDQDKTKTPVMGNPDPNIGSLYFRNISQFEFGEYCCSASNAVGSATCTVELSHELGDGAIAGAVIGALLGAVLIILIIWFMTHSMKKQKYKASKATEMQAIPKSSATVAYEGVPTRESGHQAYVTSGGVPMATNSHVHSDADGERAEA